MSAGSFIAACFDKTEQELEAAITAPEKPAASHNIPVAWAAFYLKEELHSSIRAAGRIRK